MGIFDFLKPKEVVPYDKIYTALDRFTDASLAMPKMNNPFLFDDKGKHPMIFGYFMGAIDYIEQAYQLSPKDKQEILKQYLLNNFTDSIGTDVKALVKYCLALKETHEGSQYVLRGKLSMKKWAAGGPMAAHAPMGLIRILND